MSHPEGTPDLTPTDDAAEHESPEHETSEQPAAEPDEPEPDPDTPDNDEQRDHFPRDYVERLRGESHRYRKRAQSAELRSTELADALWTARVAATDRLADAGDLPLPDEADPLDAEALDAAIDGLLEAKPHLAARRARGDVGAHSRAERPTPNLAEMMRARA